MVEDPFDAFPDPQELLGGLPAKRANTLVFLIESRTALLVARSREAVDRFLSEEAAQERQLAFVEAFALAREPPIRPAIQDLERYAEQWAALVPDNPMVRAAVAHRLGEKHEFRHAIVPALRAALGLDDAAVKDAYARLYREPLESIYTKRRRPVQRLRWRWAALGAWLDNLPPFWTAYALTLTETVGASVLALPIAVAAVGPLAGAVILVVLGAVNVITVAFMAEAVARSGAMRYSGAFFGRLVSDYLGRGGSAVLTSTLFVFCLLILPVYYLGFSRTLGDATALPDVVFVALLFLVGLYYLRRQSLNATIATALMVGAVNIGLLVALSLLALAHLNPDNLMEGDLPLVGGGDFEPSVIALLFGVILAAYFGHTSVAICGRLVLRRDPSARSLTWGCVAAQATAMLLYVVFVVAVSGAIAPERLEQESGTALAPLAAEVGPAVHVLGSAFVVLGMGMASITFSLGLFNLVRERLPSGSPRLVVIPRRRARLVFGDRRHPGSPDALRLGLVYLGLERGAPRVRIDVERGGRTHRVEPVASGRLEVLGPAADSALLEEVPQLRDAEARLALEAAGADEHELRLRVTSTLTMRYVGGWDSAGLRAGDVLALPDAEAALLGRLMRQGGASLSELVTDTDSGEDAVRRMLDLLVARGVVAETRAGGQRRYAAVVAPRPGSRLPASVLEAIADGREEAGADGRPPDGRGTLVGQRLQAALLGRRARFALGAGPVVAAFLAAEWMVITGSGSFTGLLSFAGVIAVGILAGIFPVLLVISSRRKGDHAPGIRYRLLGSRPLMAAIYGLFLAGILLHGLVIWDNALERVGALGVSVLTLAMTILIARRGAFASRLTVELRDDRSDGTTRLAVSAGGEPVLSRLRLEYPEGEQQLGASAGCELSRFGSLRGVIVEPRWETIRPGPVPEVKVWAHAVNADGESEALPARVAVDDTAGRSELDLELARGAVVLPLRGPRCRVAIRLER